MVNRSLFLWSIIGNIVFTTIFFPTAGRAAGYRQILPAENTPKNWFGQSIAISDAAYIFTKKSGTLTCATTLYPHDGTNRDLFGSSVAITNTHLIIGASNGSGAAYLYARDGD